MTIFQWDDKNVLHIADHNVEPNEAQYVVDHARPPYPEEGRDEKLIVRGQTEQGRYLQVAFVYLEDEEVDVEQLTLPDRIAFEEGESVAYVVHARDLTTSEKRQLRRRIKR